PQPADGAGNSQGRRGSKGYGFDQPCGLARTAGGTGERAVLGRLIRSLNAIAAYNANLTSASGESGLRLSVAASGKTCPVALDGRHDCRRGLESANLGGQNLFWSGQQASQTRTHGARGRVRPQLLQVREQDRLRLGPAAQKQVNPGPGLAVLSRRHVFHLLQPLEPRQIRAEGLSRGPAHLRQVRFVDAGSVP